jgi:hypothetical protein
MRRRCCIEWLGHKEIRVTNFAHQRVISPAKLSNEVGLDLITMKITKPDDLPILELLCEQGSGNISDPFQLAVLARTKESGRDRIKSFSIKDGPSQTISVDFPEDKPPRRR